MKTAAALLCLLALTLASGCTGIRNLDQDEIPTFTLNEIRTAPQKLTTALTEGGDGAIVSVARGETLPFDIAAGLPFVRLVTGGNWLRFEQDVWFYFAEDDILISPDGERFGPVYNMRALKELFHFKAGSLALGFGVASPGGARVALTLLSQQED